MYPNPLRQDDLTVRFYSAGSGEAMFAVHNLEGEIVLKERITVASGTINVPHPYSLEDAIDWLTSHRERQEAGQIVVRAITLRDDGILAGSIGLEVELPHNRAELGYWMGEAYRGRGLATEAARGMVDLAFGEMHLHRVHAHHFVRNPGSGRVLEKAGFSREGVLREHVLKDGRFEDLVAYGMVRSAWEKRRG
jgi:RimJ/RimL family protein N-acetyltransferase